MSTRPPRAESTLTDGSPTPMQAEPAAFQGSLGQHLPRVEQISARRPAEERRKLARRQLVGVEHRDVADRERAHRTGRAERITPQRCPEDEVHVYLERAGPARHDRIRESPLPTGVVGGDALDLDAEPPADRLDRLLDLWPLCEHRLAVSRADVVQVDVDRESGQVEHEEVEGGPSLQHHAAFEEGVTAEPVEQRQQPLHLSEGFDMEPRIVRRPDEIGFGQHQSTSSQDRERTCSGTTSFQRGTSFPGRRPGSK